MMVRTGGPLTVFLPPGPSAGPRGEGVNGDGERRPPLAERKVTCRPPGPFGAMVAWLKTLFGGGRK
jgi:hypothetical protein